MNFLLDKSCHAGLGYWEGQPTKVSLANCPARGPTHEIGHALGIEHEQSRSDRDENIIVFMANVKPESASNYDKEPTINFNVPYDYYSLMHYRERSFGIDGKRAMLAKDARFQTRMGKGTKITHWNAKLMNTMYGCIDDWLKACKKESEPCKNGGYTQKDCSCACPLGTTGDKCENLVLSYRDALIKQLSPYTSVISTSGAVVVSPGYPDKGPSTETQYTQVFRATECQRAVVKFDDFGIQPRNSSNNLCGSSFLEIRSDVSVPEGKIFCGEEIKKGTAFESDKSVLILHYTNGDYTKHGKENTYRGYKATFTTEAIPNCS
ncbi:blastula protease 10-like [Hyalella azteca]|uniref:Metalloendopeptidase n=1 Tax=Hyalella azteca TaxID=294128 RepID=A0A979FXG7_HYAAZ|nr:blastula protease 10-like [Hyalella azteca]